jgi:membrane associated rhomboid family serine protease
MSATLIAIFSSERRPECEERAFVLSAVGIPNAIVFDGLHFLLEVDFAVADAARQQLEQYAVESRPPPPPPPPMPVHPYAWLGCLLYAAVLIGVAFLISNGFWRLDAFDMGELDAGQMQQGQWWRAWTALTLHVDIAHLGGNLAAGIWFGYLAGRQIGTGTSWLLIVLGAGLANLLEGLLGPAAHHAVGASTAVFTALGLLAAHSWQMRFRLPQRWAARWGPLVGGVVLLGLTGSGGERTDVVAHLLGFLVGIGLGASVAQPSVSQAFGRVPQWACGVAAVAPLVIAWMFALAS